MEFKVKEKSKIKVVDSGKEYLVNKPTVEQIEQYGDDFTKAKETGAPVIGIIKMFISGLGLPMEVLNKWELDTLMEFVEFMSQGKKNSP